MTAKLPSISADDVRDIAEWSGLPPDDPALTPLAGLRVDVALLKLVTLRNGINEAIGGSSLGLTGPLGQLKPNREAQDAIAPLLLPLVGRRDGLNAAIGAIKSYAGDPDASRLADIWHSAADPAVQVFLREIGARYTGNGK